MPLALPSRTRLVGLAIIPLALLSIHTCAKAFLTLTKHDEQLDADIRLLFRTLRRHFYRDQSTGHRSLIQHMGAVVAEKSRVRSRLGTASRDTWGYKYRIIYSLIKEYWTGRAARTKYEQRWGAMMKSRREEYENWKRFGLWEKDDDDDPVMGVRNRRGVPQVMVERGTERKVIDVTHAGGSGSNEADEIDDAEEDRDDVSWRLSQGPLDPGYCPYLRTKKKKSKTPSIEL